MGQKHTPQAPMVMLGAPCAEDTWEDTHSLSLSSVFSLSRTVCCDQVNIHILNTNTILLNFCCFQTVTTVLLWLSPSSCLQADIPQTSSKSFMRAVQEAIEVASTAEWLLFYALWQKNTWIIWMVSVIQMLSMAGLVPGKDKLFFFLFIPQRVVFLDSESLRCLYSKIQ